MGHDNTLQLLEQPLKWHRFLFIRIWNKSDTGTEIFELGRSEKSSNLMPYGILKIFGNIPSLTGLCIAGIFSASLGTLSAAAVNALANITVEDFIKRFCFCKRANDIWMAFVAKILAAGYICIILLMSILISNFRGVLEASFVFVGMSAAPILGMYMLGIFTTRANETGALIGVLAGVLFYAWAGFGAYSNKSKGSTLSRVISGCYVNSTWGDFSATTLATFAERVTGVSNITEVRNDEVFHLYKWSYMWYYPIALSITITIGYIASYVLSFCMDAPDVKPEYISPFVRKLHFSPTYTAVGTKASNMEMEMNTR
ncbi:unnamed protein product [Larinioides sclopetarius]|uniref:Sodium-dependent multivitamin transporter n=1 Tax=Larinioides sclopetarius TaxID=280406 RepID=A0AAV1Z4A4_9ARAC